MTGDGENYKKRRGNMRIKERTREENRKGKMRGRREKKKNGKRAGRGGKERIARGTRRH